MAGKDGKEDAVQGQKLICPICEQTQFWTRRTLLNTRFSTILEFDWANRRAINFVRERCGHTLWFLPR